MGYYVNSSKSIKPVNLNDGNGNFFLKPNGGLLITKDNAIICESSEISKYSEIKTGVQSGPMLLLNGSLNPQFDPGSLNKKTRCGVGRFTDKNNDSYLIFCISNVPVSFYTFGVFFQKKFNCKDALCLESGGSIMNLPYSINNTAHSRNIIHNYIFFQL